MEVYEEVEGNAFNAYDAPDATATTREEDLNQPAQIAGQAGVEAEGNQLVSLRALKATSGNVAKRLRTRQETRLTTKSGKTAEAAIRQIATQERLVEKEKLKVWKQVIMQEVAQEIQAIRQAYEEALETQRHDFQTELERVNGRLYQIEAQSTTFENEITVLKAQKHVANQRSTQDTPKTPMVPPNTKPTEGSKTTNPIQKSYAQIAASSPARETTEKTWTEVIGKNQKRKSITPNPPKLEPERRRVIFRREPTSARKSEADLMLILNESLQKAGIPAYTRFSRVGYSQSGAISALLTEKSNAENLVRDHSNMLIRAAKSVEKKVIGIEALERW